MSAALVNATFDHIYLDSRVRWQAGGYVIVVERRGVEVAIIKQAAQNSRPTRETRREIRMI